MVDFYDFKSPYDEITGKAKFGRTYMNIPSAHIEFDLKRFQTWYKPFDFANSLSQLESDNWAFRIVMLFPHLYGQPDREEPGVKTRPKNETSINFMKYRGMAYTFYNKVFVEGLEKVLEQSLMTDPTIMLLAYKKPTRATVTKGLLFCNIANGVKTVAAVTFRPVSFVKPGPAFIIFLGVSNKHSTAPKCLGSWRRQGFAIFMIVHVIKFCASRRDTKTDKDTKFESSLDQVAKDSLSIYLQCSSDAEAFQFYVRLGFVHINKDVEDDGIYMLPIELMESLGQGSDLAFRHFASTSEQPRIAQLQEVGEHSETTTTNDNPASRLMQLHPGALQGIEVIDLNKDDGKDDSDHDPSDLEKNTWCRFPMYLPGLPRTQPVLSCDEMNTIILKDLNVLHLICPVLKNKVPLLSARKMYVAGDMMLPTRLDHTKKMGTEWMGTFSLDMMLAFWLRDGRYEMCSTVIPFRHVKNIANAFKAHQRLKAMHDLLVGKEHMTEKEQKEIVQQTLHEEPDEIRTKQQSTLDYVIKEIIVRNPGIFEKGLIVIPSLLSDDHWVCTFIYNAGHILNQSPGQPRAGFYRYCPKDPSGAKPQPSSFGLIWLLNLAYSYWQHTKKRPLPTTGMAWIEPFGSSDVPNLIGTENFPAFRFLPDSVDNLPKQFDGYNCGVGVVATIGIVLRETATVSDFEFISKFLRVSPSPTKSLDGIEYVHFFHMAMFERLPSEVNGRDFLQVVREEFFIAFDRLAEYQHIKLRARYKLPLTKERKAEFKSNYELMRPWPIVFESDHDGTTGSMTPTKLLQTQGKNPISEKAKFKTDKAEKPKKTASPRKRKAKFAPPISMRESANKKLAVTGVEEPTTSSMVLSAAQTIGSLATPALT
jgi:hypothetical protein